MLKEVNNEHKNERGRACLESVSPLVVRVVADMARVIYVHERVWTIVNRQAQYRDVVGVKHPMLV